jgi:two-component system cell cycle sensor histidine kinase/response regulator CckA
MTVAAGPVTGIGATVWAIPGPEVNASSAPTTKLTGFMGPSVKEDGPLRNHDRAAERSGASPAHREPLDATLARQTEGPYAGATVTISRRDPPPTTPRPAQDLLGHVPAQPRNRGERLPWTYLLVFLAGAMLVVLALWYVIASQRASILSNWQKQVESIANDRVRLVDSWLNARRTDADVLAASPPVRALLLHPEQGNEALGGYLDRVVGAYGYAGIAIFDPRGRMLGRSRGTGDPDAESARMAAAVAQTRIFQMNLVEESAGRRRLTIAVPVFAEPGVASTAVLGVVAVRLQPEAGLYRLLTEEPPQTDEQTDETLLFRLDATGSAYLSPFREPPAGWAAVSRSVEALVALATQAGSSRGGFGEAVDYRAIPVFAAVRPIPHTDWGLALKVDRNEVLRESSRSQWLLETAGALLLLGFAGLLISIGRQRQRAQLLRAQVEQERALSNLRGYAEKIVASVPTGLLMLSADLVILSVNPSFLQAFRLREDDVVGRPLAEVTSTEALIRRAREALETGGPQHNLLFDLYLIPRHETRPVLVTMTRIRMAGNEPARLLLIVQDLTEEERLQAARRASEERFRDLVQGLDAIVWEADAGTLKFSFVSQRAETILGYPVARWLTTPDFFMTRIHPDDRARARQLCRDAIAENADHELEYRAITASGQEVWLRDIVHVVPGVIGRPAQLRGLTVDLTERKRAEEALRQTEEQLRQAQKMDAVGKLAGGIAHDFNNILMVIRGEADLILRRLEDGSPLRHNTEGIREASDQAATLTRQLLAFSRKQVLAPSIVDLNGVVAAVQQMLRRLIGETINLITITAPDLGCVRADPGQLEQMVINLAVNARDAMPDGGRLTIVTANVEVDEGAATPGVPTGRYVMLEVSDTGIGIDRETQAHLFEPFFTTKEHGKGTGLGLSTVYGIVNQSGGHISVQSEPGKGAAFRVYLPRIEQPAQAAEDGTSPRLEEPPAAVATPAARREALVSGARETVLLVEDARRVREVVREILEMNGYQVLEARQGEQAIEISAQHPGPIHLMVTDVVMPEMSGRELAQRLTLQRPDMRVLYMSGYTDDAIVRHGVLDAGMAFIAKPFTPDGLAGKVRQLLEAPSRSQPAEVTAGSAGGPEGLGSPRS